jgi:hypothetical protein
MNVQSAMASDFGPNSRSGAPRLLVANPAAMLLKEGARLAVGHGLDRDGERRLREALRRPEPGTALGKIVAAQEEATIVLADAAALGGQSIEAWRGVTSNFEAYLVDIGPDQPPSIADHFRDALALVSPARRTLDPKAVADHLLFGTTPGTHTYATAIRRLGHGEHFRWRDGRAEARLFDSLVARPSEDPPSLDDVDAGLSRALRREACVNQLSGGVDSSLLHTYLRAGTPTVSGAIDSPEFARERTYAEEASRLLGTKHEVVAAAEGEYQKMLIDVIRLSGLPIHMPQTAVYQLSFQYPAACFVNGQFADALFGLRPSIAYTVAVGQRRWLRLAEMLTLDRMLPRAKAQGLRRRLERLRQVEAPMHRWQGVGARFAIYTNPVLAERILGQTATQQRIEARAAYVAERFRSEELDANPLYAHLEFGHMLDFYCDESVSQWRQLAQAQGRSLLAPFVCRSVVGAALAVRRRQRYIANGRIKYLLKDLLKQRLPPFDVDAQKAGGDLPFPRYLRSGPLKNAFDHYAIPDIVDSGIAAATRAAPDWLTWNLLTLAIWRDEVLADTTLTPRPGTRVLAPSSSSVF